LHLTGLSQMSTREPMTCICSRHLLLLLMMMMMRM